MNVRALCQYPTPAWAALSLWQEVVSVSLPENPVVVEPTCGDGRMLAAVPSRMPAFGAEIDEKLAERARERTGREIFCGDFFDWELPPGVNVAWGNPPFRTDFFDRLLDRFASEMPMGGRCWFLAPAYFFQTPSHVLRWNRAWTMQADLVPRTVWTGLETPLVFANFTKDPRPRLRGMRLYVEQDLAASCRPDVREEISSGSGLWSSAVGRALTAIGGRAHLSEIYDAMLKRRPTENRHWRQMIRKVLQEGPFNRVSRGVWELAPGLQN